jgi:hypothetical protein
LGEQRQGVVNVEVERRLEDLFGEEDLHHVQEVGQDAGSFPFEDLGTQEADRPSDESAPAEADAPLVFEAEEPDQVLVQDDHAQGFASHDTETEEPDQVLVQDDHAEGFAPFESETGEPPHPLEAGSPAQPSPLRELESAVLALDWEISDELMSKFLEQVKILKTEYENEKSTLLLLHLLDSVGSYIKTNKARAHPDAIKVLNEEYNSLEKMILTEDLTEEERKRTLVVEVKRFRKLKEDIALRKSGMGGKRAAGQAERTGAVVTSAGTGFSPERDGRVVWGEAFDRAVDEIKQMIRSEFDALRAEMKSWKEELRTSREAEEATL